MTEKANKEDVNYSRGMPRSHCGPMFNGDTGYCEHFIANKRSGIFGGCELVKGEIKNSFWCQKWKKAVTK